MGPPALGFVALGPIVVLFPGGMINKNAAPSWDGVGLEKFGGVVVSAVLRRR
jgi:hypothetical protein